MRSWTGLQTSARATPGEQADRVGVGAVVDARGVVAGVEEDPGEDDRADRPGEHAEQQAAAAEELHPGGEDERPEEVELLLHRERPEVGEERRAARTVRSTRCGRR